MILDRCGECKEVRWNGESHRCLPAFLVWYEGHGDDPEEAHDVVHAYNDSYAVEAWASEHDSYGDYTIVGGSDETVKVRPRGETFEGKWVTFSVSGESVPSYHATKMEETK